MYTARLTSSAGSLQLRRWLECDPVDPHRFFAEVKTLLLGNTLITELSVSTVTLDRVLLPGGDRLLHFLFPTQGEAIAQEHEGMPFALGPGSGFLLPGCSRYRFHSTTGLSGYLISLQAAGLAELLPREMQNLMPLSRESQLALPVQAFITELHRQPVTPTGVAQYAAERIVHEMLSSLVLDTVGFSGPINGVNAAIKERALAYIAEQKNDPSLSVQDIATALNVSSRQLQRIFQEAGTTVTREIRRQRARAAHVILRQPKYDVLSVEQVAERTGFTDAKDLRRALAQHYGASPREIRQTR